MTKRYTIEPTMIRECIVDNHTGEQLDTYDYTERLCEILNKQHEENKQLKELITQKGYIIKYDRYGHISLELKKRLKNNYMKQEKTNERNEYA